MTAEARARCWVRCLIGGLLAALVGASSTVYPTTTTTTLPILGRAYYVSPAGNDGNPGTQDAPFGTISHGLEVVAPGDTIVVRDGVYAEALTPHTSGTSGAPITLRAEHDGQAVVDGLGVRRPLVVQGVSHTAYEGLRVRSPRCVRRDRGMLAPCGWIARCPISWALSGPRPLLGRRRETHRVGKNSASRLRRRPRHYGVDRRNPSQYKTFPAARP